MLTNATDETKGAIKSLLNVPIDYPVRVANFVDTNSGDESVASNMVNYPYEYKASRPKEFIANQSSYKEKYKGEYDVDTAHYNGVKELKECGVRPELYSDNDKNYRMANAFTNKSFHVQMQKEIDNAIVEGRNVKAFNYYNNYKKNGKDTNITKSDCQVSEKHGNLG